ncbi:carboxypeptidase-like regulatory domain-containing protein [Mucilaginibacter sp. BJC16-A38]|uniref:carboxypeptidase-like regulatory domain-containing protein n=1 Tax=Mucilaginibacter phenanthrenivorans TaxID=1234842 RepID=UPI0021586770|nr:carboxypeptidase-like regulatory domain-containing protein [Mucilaginibacter phenanthrenivorans]MCR8557824.1 carboxypeptidase-like regulatory domain-containing protein [Mucilaginibacter phenanthrenivorans]
MKIFFRITLSAFLLSGTVAFGQTIAVTGTVNNEKGKPIPFAFVRDAQHNYATYADSTGSYQLNADPASSLQVIANGYVNTDVKIDNKTNINVTLPAGKAESPVSPLKSGNEEVDSHFLNARELYVYGGGNANAGGQETIKEGFTQEPTRGSRYLYKEWAPGLGISKEDKLIVETTNLYNYDKINGDILYTNDGKSMAKVSTDQIKTFSLYDNAGHAHLFVAVPEIKGKTFTEVLLSTPKYKIYKKVDAKLLRADFHTNGVIETGHRYDEFINDERYYFVGADNKLQSISLKKSTLKKLLAGDADGFISSQGSRDVDEDYVRDLGKSLSK